jgi:hypothetical protein
VDALSFSDQLRYRSAERWGINRTDVMRQFPWPEGERFVPEGLVWNRISRRYAARFINEPLRIYETDTAGLSTKMTELRISSPEATLLYYREIALAPAPVLQRIRGALNYCRFAALTTFRRQESR